MGENVPGSFCSRFIFIRFFIFFFVGYAVNKHDFFPQECLKILLFLLNFVWIVKPIYAHTITSALHSKRQKYFYSWSCTRNIPFSYSKLCSTTFWYKNTSQRLVLEHWHLEHIPCSPNHGEYCVSFVHHTRTWLMVVVVIHHCCDRQLLWWCDLCSHLCSCFYLSSLSQVHDRLSGFSSSVNTLPF